MNATCAEFSAARGVSKERVRQIERCALAKLGHAMEPEAPRPAPKPRRPKPQPGHFVVLTGLDRLPTALDAGGALRVSHGEVAVFTDRMVAKTMAGRFRVREHACAHTVETRPVEEGGDTPWGAARLVRAAPARSVRAAPGWSCREIADAVRVAIAEAGRPLTLAEIARALSEPCRAAGFPGVGYEAVRMAVRRHSIPEVSRRGRRPMLFGLAAAPSG